MTETSVGSPSAVLDEYLAEAMECPVCTQVYEQPKQLHCGHSLCSVCVEKLVDQARATMAHGNHGLGGIFNPPRSTAIDCPVCRQSTMVPTQGLPTSFGFLGLISRIRDSQKKARNCGSCTQIVKYDAQLCCETCGESGGQMKVFCTMCAINDHAKLGHNVFQVGSALEETRRDALKQIKSTAAISNVYVEGCATSAHFTANTISAFHTFLKEQLRRYEETCAELDRADVCTKKFAEEKVANMETLGRGFETVSTRFAKLMQETSSRIEELGKFALKHLDEAAQGIHPTFGSVTDGACLHDLTISPSSKASTSRHQPSEFFAYERNPQQSRGDAARNRRAVIARRRAGRTPASGSAILSPPPPRPASNESNRLEIGTPLQTPEDSSNESM